MGPAANTENPVKPTEAMRPPRRDPLVFAGTIHRIDAEGGIYVIRAADGTEYRPKELPAEYRVEGMAVDVKAQLNDDVATKDMVGQPIDLLEIVRRDAG